MWEKALGLRGPFYFTCSLCFVLVAQDATFLPLQPCLLLVAAMLALHGDSSVTVSQGRCSRLHAFLVMMFILSNRKKNEYTQASLELEIYLPWPLEW